MKDEDLNRIVEFDTDGYGTQRTHYYSYYNRKPRTYCGQDIKEGGWFIDNAEVDCTSCIAERVKKEHSDTHACLATKQVRYLRELFEDMYDAIAWSHKEFADDYRERLNNILGGIEPVGDERHCFNCGRLKEKVCQYYPNNAVATECPKNGFKHWIPEDQESTDPEPNVPPPSENASLKNKVRK